MVYNINKFIMKTSILAGLLLLSSYWLQAQSQQELEYAAYLKAGKSLWERCVDQANRQHGGESFEATMAAYGLLNSTMATEDETTFDDNVDQVVDHLKAIIKEKPQWGEPQAVLSTVYGLKMAYSPMKGIIYGSKSGSLIESAVKLQPESPLVQKLYGSYKLYTPSMFGGDAEEAVKAFTLAVQLYEDLDSSGNWLYLDALVHLALSYRKTQQTDQAITVLEKAINLEPDFNWAKAILASYQKN